MGCLAISVEKIKTHYRQFDIFDILHSHARDFEFRRSAAVLVLLPRATPARVITFCLTAHSFLRLGIVSLLQR